MRVKQGERGVKRGCYRVLQDDTKGLFINDINATQVFYTSGSNYVQNMF